MMGFGGGYGMMCDGWGGGFFAFSWVFSILALVLMVLGVIALWKYINRKD